MREKRRIPWKWLLAAGLVLFLGFQFGGGLWGWGRGLTIEEVASLPEERPLDLVRKREAFLRIVRGEGPERQEALEEADRLGRTLELWAEDRYLGAEIQVGKHLGEGKREEALRLLDQVPKEYEATSFGVKFRELRRRATSD